MSGQRPTQEQREAVAKDIKAGGAGALELESEEVLGVGLLSGGTPILDEAAAERAEGGGVIAEAVKEFDQEQANSTAD